VAVAVLPVAVPPAALALVAPAVVEQAVVVLEASLSLPVQVQV